MPAQLTSKRATEARRILLRAPADEDFAALAELRRDPHIQDLLLSVVPSADDDAVRAWIERRSRDTNGAFRVVAEAETDQALGFVQLTDIHHRNRWGTGGIALLPHAQGKGIGRSALDQLHQYAHKEKGLDKLLLYVRPDNVAALALYLRSGYRVLGTLADHFRDHGGRLHDVLLLERKLGEHPQ